VDLHQGAPGETCRAGNRLLLACSVSFRNWLPSAGRSRQADQAARIAARLLPAAMSRMPMGLAWERLACSCITKPPVTAGSRSAFPLQSESRCVSGGLVSGARSHAGWGSSTGAEAGLWMMLGTSRAWVLTTLGMAVDNPVEGWGRAPEGEISLLTATCSKGCAGPVDSKKLGTWCRDPVRYSGR
jgi:hypothetical protein